MSLKIIKIFLVIAITAAIIRGIYYLLDESFELKTLYYKFLEPVMKYRQPVVR